MEISMAPAQRWSILVKKSSAFLPLLQSTFNITCKIPHNLDPLFCKPHPVDPLLYWMCLNPSLCHTSWHWHLLPFRLRMLALIHWLFLTIWTWNSFNDMNLNLCFRFQNMLQFFGKTILIFHSLPSNKTTHSVLCFSLSLSHGFIQVSSSNFLFVFSTW